VYPSVAMDDITGIASFASSTANTVALRELAPQNLESIPWLHVAPVHKRLPAHDAPVLRLNLKDCHLAAPRQEPAARRNQTNLLRRWRVGFGIIRQRAG